MNRALRLRRSIRYPRSRNPSVATPGTRLGKAWSDYLARELFTRWRLSVRDRMVDRMLETEERYRREDPKRINYLSIEFLIGQSLGNNLHNLGIRELIRQALNNLGAESGESRKVKEMPHWAMAGWAGWQHASWIRSPRSGMPGYGYGINYEYGLFKQEIDNGYQREKPDNWLARARPGRSPARMKLAWFPSMAASSTASIAKAVTTPCGWTGKS